MSVPAALTVAGSDPTGGAGIQQDLHTFASLGVRGVSAITAVTAQTRTSPVVVWPLGPPVVEAQIAAALADGDISAAKTGMLANRHIVDAVVRAFATAGGAGGAGGIPLVVDPVMDATVGGILLDAEGRVRMAEALLPLARLVTPNALEASILAGFEISTLDDQVKAAEAIRGLGARAVLVKGGHVGGAESVDVLDDDGDVTVFRSPRIHGPGLHGSGCVLSAAITAGLALGRELTDAIADAKKIVEGRIRKAAEGTS